MCLVKKQHNIKLRKFNSILLRKPIFIKKIKKWLKLRLLYKFLLKNRQVLRIFFLERNLKKFYKKIKQISLKKNKLFWLNVMFYLDKKLSSVLYFSGFFVHFKLICQLIKYKFVKVNCKVIRNYNFVLHTLDIVTWSKKLYVKLKSNWFFSVEMQKLITKKINVLILVNLSILLLRVQFFYSYIFNLSYCSFFYKRLMPKMSMLFLTYTFLTYLKNQIENVNFYSPKTLRHFINLKFDLSLIFNIFFNNACRIFCKAFLLDFFKVKYFFNVDSFYFKHLYVIYLFHEKINWC